MVSYNPFVPDPDAHLKPPAFLAGIETLDDLWEQPIYVLRDDARYPDGDVACGLAQLYGPYDWQVASCTWPPEASVTVICRRCGRREFQFCDGCLAELLHAEEWPSVLAYCTAPVRPHQIVCVAELNGPIDAQG